MNSLPLACRHSVNSRFPSPVRSTAPRRHGLSAEKAQYTITPKYYDTHARLLR